MTAFAARITIDGANPLRGDSLRIERTVTSIPEGDSIVAAWFTVKKKPKSLDDDAALQLAISDTETAAGHIVADGSEGDGSLVFTIHGSPDFDKIVAGVDYYYDTQIRTDLGVIATRETGRIKWEQDITQVV
jgi:hypothetical protein